MLSPIGDVMRGNPGPWIKDDLVAPFTACNQYKTFVNLDRPTLARPDGQPPGNTSPHHFIPWDDPRTGATNMLRSINWGILFMAFGVLRNRRTGELQQFQHVYWSMAVSANFNREHAIGSRGTLVENDIQHSGVLDGASSEVPLRTVGPFANDSTGVVETAT